MAKDEFGGVAVQDAAKDDFGGIAVAEPPAVATPKAQTAPVGPNAARNRRQANLNSGLTPEQAQARREAVTGAINAYPGFAQSQEGINQLGTPGQRKAGLHNVFVGAGKMTAVPGLVAGAATAGLPATATAVGAGMVAAPVAEKVATMAGAEPDTAALVGDAAGVGAGAVAGSVPRVGATLRGAASGLADVTEGTGVMNRIGNALSGAWQNAKAAWNKPNPIYTPSNPRPAPPWEGLPQPQAAPVPSAEPIRTELPSGKKPGPAPTPAAKAPRPAPAYAGSPQPVPAPVPSAEPIASDLTSGRKVPTAEERIAKATAPQAAAGPKKAPSAAPAGPSKADLDTAAKSLGAKNYAAVTDPGQKAAVEGLAKKLSEPAATKPIPAPVGPVQTAPATPSPAVETPAVAQPEAKAVATPRSEADLARATAQDLVNKGVTVDQLLAMPESQRTEALGDDAHRFGDIVREMRSHVSGAKMDAARDAKDAAMAKFFTAKNISPEDVEGMDEGTLATHIKSAGYRPPGKSGALGRSHIQIQQDIANQMRSAGDTPADNEASTKVAPSPVSASVSTDSSPTNGDKPSDISQPGGVQAVVRTPAGTKAKVQYKISEANDLKTSFDPDYNTDIGHQPRDTSRIGSRQRVEQRMRDMDPEAMGPSRMAGDGAPITKEGNAVTRNHGTEALKENYARQNSKSQEYRDWVQDNAGLAGMTPEQVGAMKNPILHRELVEEWDHPKIKQFADEANQSSTARMSPSELAQNIASKMDARTMAKYDPAESGAPNGDFVREIMKGLPPEEQAELQMRDGSLNKRGEQMVRDAVFAKAYRSTKALEAMSEDPEPLVKNLTNGMLKAAPQNALLQHAISEGEAYPLGIGEQIGDAVEVIQNLREKRLKVEDWLNQNNLLGRDPVVHSLVDILAGEARRPNIIRDTLNNYVESVKNLGTPKQAGIFGQPELPSKLKLLEEAYGRAKSAAEEAAAKRKGKSEGDDLFGSQPGNSPAGEGSGAANH